MNKQSQGLAVAQSTARTVTAVGTTPDVITDTGRVRVGGGMLRFTMGSTPDAVRDTGKVRVGGGMLRF